MEKKFSEAESISLKEKFVSLMTMKGTGLKEAVVLEMVDKIPLIEIETLIKNLSDQIAEFEREDKKRQKLAMIDAALRVLKIEENRLLAERDKVQNEQSLDSNE